MIWTCSYCQPAKSAAFLGAQGFDQAAFVNSRSQVSVSIHRRANKSKPVFMIFRARLGPCVSCHSVALALSALFLLVHVSDEPKSPVQKRLEADRDSETKRPKEIRPRSLASSSLLSSSPLLSSHHHHTPRRTGPFPYFCLCSFCPLQPFGDHKKIHSGNSAC